MSHTQEQIKALAAQFICHPVSRSIDEFEMAGELITELLKQRDELLAALIALRERHQIDEPHHAGLCEFCKQADTAIDHAQGG